MSPTRQEPAGPLPSTGRRRTDFDSLSLAWAALGLATEGLSELALGRLQPPSIHAGQVPARPVDVEIEHRHGRLKLGSPLGPAAASDRAPQVSSDLHRRAGEDSRGQVHAVRGLLDMSDPALCRFASLGSVAAATVAGSR